MPPALAPLPPSCAWSIEIRLPVVPKLVPPTMPLLAFPLASRPCHWKPTLAAFVPETSTIRLSM